MNAKPPDSSLYLSTHCPHCPAMLAILGDLVKQGLLGRLEVVNIEVHPEVARSQGIRSVPWVRLGPFELVGTRSRDELLLWLERAGSESGMADYFHDLLKDGELARVLATIQATPALLAALLPIVANPEASINVRIGAGAVFEEMAGSDGLRTLVEPLGALSRAPDARVRVDACHYLGMTQSQSAIHFVRARLDDADADVREVASDSLALLTGAAAG
jgi:hypothetical protein